MEAAEADLEAGEENRRAVLLSILAEVARNYAEFRCLQQRLEIADRDLQAQRQTLGLTIDLADKGIARQLDVARASAQVSTTEASLPRLRNLQWQAMHRLAVLTGCQPGTLVEELSQVGPIFVWWELRTKEQIVNLRILRNRNFLTGSVLITVVGAVLYGATALLLLFVQTLLGYPAFQSGLAVSPRGMGSFVAMFLVGRLVGRIDARLLLLAGFLALGYSAYALGNLNLQISPMDVMVPNIINGLALGFIFVPLTTSAMGMLRNEEMGNATGIYNLVRNIGGGAAGIAMMTTFLASGAQVHQTVLVSHMTPYDGAYQQQLHGIQSALSSHLGSYEAGQAAHAVMAARLSRQAWLWAYVDDFRMLALMAIACLPGLLLLRRLRHREVP